MKNNSGCFKKGIRYSPDTEFKKGENLHKNHPLWKDEGASYTAIHAWIYRNHGKAIKCENYPNCVYKNPHHYEWSNVSGTYKRDMSDWKQLCVSCHMIMDKRRTNKCKNGHEFNLKDVYVDKVGHRKCRLCARIYDSKRRLKRKASK